MEFEQCLRAKVNVAIGIQTKMSSIAPRTLQAGTMVIDAHIGEPNQFLTVVILGIRRLRQIGRYKVVDCGTACRVGVTPRYRLDGCHAGIRQRLGKSVHADIGKN